MEKKAQKDKQCEQAVYQVHLPTLCNLFFSFFNLTIIICHKYDELHPRDSWQTVKLDLKQHQCKRMTYRAPTFRFHQWHHLPIVLISPSSVLSSLHLLFNFSLSLSPSLSLFLWWLPNDYLNAGKLLCLAVLSAYSFYSTGLTLRLFPLFCLLLSASSLLPVWSLPLSFLPPLICRQYWRRIWRTQSTR